MNEKIKECPFCGGKAEIITNQDENIACVSCLKCGSRNFWSSNAHELWNKRTTKDTSLLPCPVCGHKGNLLEAQDSTFCVLCFHCGLTTNFFDNPDEAKSAWNWSPDDYV